MKLLLLTFPDSAGQGDENDLGGLECAVVDVTPELVRRIDERLRSARQFMKAEQDLAEVSFLDATPSFYGHELIDACEDICGADWFDAFYNQEVVLLPAEIELAKFQVQPAEDERVEFCLCCPPHIGTSDHRISWCARRRSSGIAVHTAALTLDHPLFQRAREEAGTTP